MQQTTKQGRRCGFRLALHIIGKVSKGSQDIYTPAQVMHHTNGQYYLIVVTLLHEIVGQRGPQLKAASHASIMAPPPCHHRFWDA